jgi:hypothetical protein
VFEFGTHQRGNDPQELTLRYVAGHDSIRKSMRSGMAVRGWCKVRFSCSCPSGAVRRVMNKSFCRAEVVKLADTPS